MLGIAIGIVIMGSHEYAPPAGIDKDIVLSATEFASQESWRDLSIEWSYAGPFQSVVFGVCAMEDATLPATSGQYEWYKIVAETDPPPQGTTPPWDPMFDPVGSTGPYQYNWSFTAKTLLAGQGFTHYVTYLRNCDKIALPLPGYFNLSIPAVQNLAYGYEEGNAFIITDYARRINGSEAAHNQMWEITDGCGGHAG